MAVPKRKNPPYIPHAQYMSNGQQSFHRPFPPPPSKEMGTESPPPLPRIQTQDLDVVEVPLPPATQAPAPAYQAHLQLPVPQLPHAQAPSPMSSAKSTYLSVSPVDPVRERTSLQCFATPVVSRFSQNSFEIQPHPVVQAIRLFIIRWVIEWWLMEIISWIFSTMCMAIVIGVLLMYDNQEIPNWPLGLNMSGFLAVFSAFAKAGLVLPTAECIGQLKWNWFKEKPRSLIDFEILDAASRGPWGSILLMIRALRERGLSLASIGGAVIILCLPLDLFFQQVVDQPRVWVEQPNLVATIPRAISYTPQSQEFWQNGTGPIFPPDLTMEQVLQPFAYADGKTPDLELSCPTSNCTWQPFESLSISSFCNDQIVSELEFGCFNATADWPADVTDYAALPPTFTNAPQCGWFLNASSDSRVLMSGYLYDPITEQKGEVLETRVFPLLDSNTKQSFYAGSVHFRHLVNPVLDVIIAHTPGGPAAVHRDEKPIAYECALAWSAQTLQTSHYEGNLTQNITTIHLDETQAPFAWKVNSDFYYEYSYNFSITPRNQHQVPMFADSNSNQTVTYTVSNETALPFQFLVDSFAPSFVTKRAELETAEVKYYTLYTGNAGGAKVKRTMNPPWRGVDIPSQMKRLAEATTNVIRNTPNSSGQLEMVRGTAWLLRVHVNVRWEWLILPLMLSAISLIFLASTVSKSSREIDEVGIWKNSALAILFNGLGEDVQRSVGNQAKMGEIRNKAMDLSVQIFRD